MADKFKFKSKRKKEKIRLFDFSENAVDLNMVSGTHIEMFSNQEIVIEGCRGVCDYSNEYIKLRLLKGSLTLCGNNFDIRFYEENVIRITGTISTIEFAV